MRSDCCKALYYLRNDHYVCRKCGKPCEESDDLIDIVKTPQYLLNNDTISIPDSGNTRSFEGGAIRDDDSKKPDYTVVDWEGFEEFVFYKMAGNAKYGKNNYLLGEGIPPTEFLKSAIRHLIKLIKGMEDERHDLAVIWNIFAFIEVRRKNA